MRGVLHSKGAPSGVGSGVPGGGGMKPAGRPTLRARPASSTCATRGVRDEAPGKGGLGSRPPIVIEVTSESKSGAGAGGWGRGRGRGAGPGAGGRGAGAGFYITREHVGWI